MYHNIETKPRDEKKLSSHILLALRGTPTSRWSLLLRTLLLPLPTRATRPLPQFLDPRPPQRRRHRALLSQSRSGGSHSPSSPQSLPLLLPGDPLTPLDQPRSPDPRPPPRILAQTTFRSHFLKMVVPVLPPFFVDGPVEEEGVVLV